MDTQKEGNTKGHRQRDTQTKGYTQKGRDIQRVRDTRDTQTDTQTHKLGEQWTESERQTDRQAGRRGNACTNHNFQSSGHLWSVCCRAHPLHTR